MELLTVEEVAKILKIDPATVRAYLRRGDLVGIKLALNIWRIKAKDLTTFIENHTNGQKHKGS